MIPIALGFTLFALIAAAFALATSLGIREPERVRGAVTGRYVAMTHEELATEIDRELAAVDALVAQQERDSLLSMG